MADPILATHGLSKAFGALQASDAISLDLRAFGHYHKILGLNVLIPVLPLHGPRRIGRRSGDGFLGGEVLDTVHAETQAIWDIRRMIGWLRGQGALSVGATGLSLGGYTTALLAGIEAGEQL